MEMFATAAFMVQIWLVSGQGPAHWNKQAQDSLERNLKITENQNVAKNIILFIGDGMGVSTVTATRIYKGQQNNLPGEETVLSYEQFPNVALSKTYNTDYQVADSAGTATAFLSGVKTKFGTVGVDESVELNNCSTYTEQSKLDSIIQWARAAGKSTGIVTTARVTHATPAAAYGHSVSRYWETDADLPPDARGKCSDLASQFIQYAKDIDVVFGGGRRSFMRETDQDPEYENKHGKRKDGRDLIQEWKDDKQNRGLTHEYVIDKSGFDSLDLKTQRVLGLFEHSHMRFEADRSADRNGEPSLSEMVAKAIKILERNKKGYFLLVEGGRIDHAHHASKAKLALTESIEMEQAIENSQKLTSSLDTLTVVTADHSHVFTIGGYPVRGNPLFGLNTYESDLDGRPFTTLMYTNGPGFAVDKFGKRPNLKTVDTESLAYVQESGVNIKEETHGGEDVAVYASGPMSHLFRGVIEQNYIAHAMGYAACIGSNKDHCRTTSGYDYLNSSNRGKVYSKSIYFVIALLQFCVILS
ncbi:alkaline phosphatase-like [Tubulanus polymorphus]|uniref:alkaline phosphatase-like n=1 Tax=Tubulanus polymorphus TaxID=672921 RepID=UPI003DA58DC1